MLKLNECFSLLFKIWRASRQLESLNVPKLVSWWLFLELSLDLLKLDQNFTSVLSNAEHATLSLETYLSKINTQNQTTVPPPTAPTNKISNYLKKIVFSVIGKNLEFKKTLQKSLQVECQDQWILSWEMRWSIKLNLVINVNSQELLRLSQMLVLSWNQEKKLRLWKEEIMP